MFPFEKSCTSNVLEYTSKNDRDCGGHRPYSNLRNSSEKSKSKAQIIISKVNAGGGRRQQDRRTETPADGPTMELLASHLDLLRQRARDLLEHLDPPSRAELASAAAAALRDVRAATASSWHLLFITLRPVILLLGVLGGHLAAVLRVIGRHSVAHGWVAAREGWWQLRTGTIWFVRFQRDLPASAKYAEAGATAAALALWLLRRHVRKNRYVEKAAAWYRDKRRRAVRKYRRGVERVAKTSSLLALLLPHLLYLALVVGAKRMLPSVVTYLATRTYLCTVLGFWHPLYATLSALRRLAPHLEEWHREEEAQAEDGAGNGKRANAVTPSMLRKRDQQEAEAELLRAEAVDLLSYWVVYAVLLAMVRTTKLLPFVGTRLRLPGDVAAEATLLFFVWLRLMPTPHVAGEAVGTRAPGAARARHLDKHGPVDLLFRQLSPYALAAMDSSAFLAKKALGGGAKSEDSSSLLSWVLQKLSSTLDLLVLVRFISKGSRDWIVTTLAESSALLPAATTLLMPGYFTKFGVIYVSLIVPAGYSTAACDAARECGGARRTRATTLPCLDEASRYLQFWLVHAALSLLLRSCAGLLAWLPFSAHLTWLLWAYVQLDSTTRRLYVGFVRELERENLEDSVLWRSGRSLLAALPSNVSDSVARGAGPSDANDSVAQGPGGDANGSTGGDDGKNKVE